MYVVLRTERWIRLATASWVLIAWGCSDIARPKRTPITTPSRHDPTPTVDVGAEVGELADAVDAAAQASHDDDAGAVGDVDCEPFKRKAACEGRKGCTWAKYRRRCTPTNPGPCAFDCEWTGRCKLVGDTCVAASEADCLRSEMCSYAGLCALWNNGCYALSDRRCGESVLCEATGDCWAYGGECLPLTSEDCRQSMACRVFGDCTLIGSECVVAYDSDCAMSEECITYNQCKACPDMGRGMDVLSCKVYCLKR